MLVKSTWTSSKGEHAWMGHNGALTSAPSKILQRWHSCTKVWQSFTILGHQKCSWARVIVLSWPWCIASQCTPLRAVHLWAVGTTNVNSPSLLPLGVVLTYSIPFFVMKVLHDRNIAFPSSVLAWSSMYLFRSPSVSHSSMPFLLHIHLRHMANNGSSCCTASQSVICIASILRVHALASLLRHSHSSHSDALARASPLSAVPIVAPSRSDCTISWFWQMGTLLRASAAPFSHPLWYSRVKSNEASTPSHRCPVMSKLGVVITYISGLLSICTVKGVYTRYSLKCLVMLHFKARN